MDEKSVNELTEEEWKQVQQFKKKPFISVSSATFYDCTRAEGLNLNIDYIWRHSPPTLHIPTEFITPVASDHLCETLLRINEVWVLDNQKSCRILVDAILTEALLYERNENLMGFCDVKNDWEGTGFRYTGNVDYMLGSCKTKSVDIMDSCLLVSVAKEEWPDSSIAQVICEAGCLLKNRMAAGKNTPVFAILSNGPFFRFFAVDITGIAYSSGLKILRLGPDHTYKTSSELAEILRWITWFMESATSVSLSASNDDSVKIEESLVQLQKCFGSRIPKKIKIRD